MGIGPIRVLAIVAALAGCGGGRGAGVSEDGAGFISCVPYARQASGIDIRGDAWTWWDGAAGRYGRGKRPAVGAVLAFQRTGQLPSGHVSVVDAVNGPREILVNHANWNSTPAWRGRVQTAQKVVDVSPANDWSAVRVQNHLGSLGRIYPAYGFIYPSSRIVASR